LLFAAGRVISPSPIKLILGRPSTFWAIWILKLQEEIFRFAFWVRLSLCVQFLPRRKQIPRALFADDKRADLPPTNKLAWSDHSVWISLLNRAVLITSVKAASSVITAYYRTS
jgi:hypothetical protein